MTDRRLLNPDTLPASPTPEEFREWAVDVWGLISPDYRIQTNDYTTSHDIAIEYVLAAPTGSMTVYLRDGSLDGKEVYVHRSGAGGVDVETEGAEKIKLGTQLLGCVYIENEDDVIHFKWFQELDYWVMLG
jgi:hypothetical protein